MTSIIKVTCLSGGQDNSPPCYLLQVDQFKCLLDCGWDEKFSISIVDEIGKHFKSLDAILLNYPDPLHVGALPYLIKHHGIPCPIYATRPVTQMGQMFMTDLVLSKLNNQEFDLFTIDDVKKAFENDRIVHLNFNQTFHLDGQGHGLSITPLAAGHMVGGTIWKIVKDNEEDIVYAIDYNHKKERHLNGCVLDTITRPSLLITDAYNAQNHQGRMKERDQKFLSTIMETLRGGGNILIACDTAGRVLEIAYMLDHIWRNKDTGLSAYSLALVNNVATRMIDITMSTIEWMSDNILREFETSRDNPFKFKHLQLKQQLSDLEHLPQPITVLATQPDLESGFAKDLFAIWSSDPKNAIIFTQRPSVGTLGYQVLNTPSRMIQAEIWQRIELFGDELEEYKKKMEEKRQLELIESQKALAINDNDSDTDSLEEVREGKSLVPSKHDLMMNDEHERTVFFKQARKTYPMFPAPIERKLRFDDYGEEIDPQDYVLTHKMHGSNRLLEVEDNKENQSQENESEEQEPEVKPTKCVSIVATLHVQARLHLFDFEGRSDGESVKNLVSQVRPRRLILVRGSEESTKYMAEYCRAYVDDKILHPATGETVDATTENHIYQIKLKDSLLSSVQFHAINNDVELAWVDAKTHMPAEDDEVVSEKLPHLEALEPEHVPLHNSLFINELQLSKFKKDLIDNGIQAEFSDGVLYCNNKVSVRRRESGRIHLEGTLCDDYFKVRDILYGSYIVI
uniref:Cleavage and polyadenylation specificity factor subunit 2 n=1 Tax=Aceria tosichella TaxID=561515 RepID=A0A6G1SDR1_9ACAR